MQRGGQGRARWLHLAACALFRHLAESRRAAFASLRSGERPAARRPGRRGRDFAGRQPQHGLQESGGHGRLRQGQPRQACLRILGRWVIRQPGHGRHQGPLRPGHAACSLQAIGHRKHRPDGQHHQRGFHGHRLARSLHAQRQVGRPGPDGLAALAGHDGRAYASRARLQL
ncbi:hypothetical protein D3C71_1566070 [compost metagenome]